MNERYKDTFRQHRRLFLLPLLVGVVFALWVNLGAPAVYRSSTSLWSDTAGGSANDLTGAPPPAAQEQTMLNELLQTQAFQKSVAEAGPLADYLRAHPSQGWGPGVVMQKLRGAPTLDDRIATALSSKRVTSLVLGPHVLKVSYDGPTPQVSYDTLRALISQYEKQRDALRDDALNSYRDSVAAATKALSDAKTQVQTYLREHPGVSASDPGMVALQHAQRNALDQVAAATQGLTDAANSSLDSTAGTLRVVDKPEVPTAAYGTHKKLLFGLIAGLFVGALVSGIAIYAITKRSGGAPVAEVEVVRRGEPNADPQQVPLREEPPVAAARAGQATLRRRKRTG
jgi:uncharacterized protein involved in exopolysaccharide biosynthesis